MQAVCAILETLLSEGVFAAYAIGGATAAGFYGEPLATRDVDVFVFLEPTAGSLLVSLDGVYRSLQGLGFDSFDEEGILIHGYPVQFLSARPGLEKEAVEKARIFCWEGGKARVILPEYLAAIALSVGRPKDRARVVYLASLEDFDRGVLENIVSRHGLAEVWVQWSSALGLE